MARKLQLDGVRGVGTLVIIVHHHDLITNRLLKSASCSVVDLFFVLSGYLITRNLVAARFAPDYWRSFSIKRAGRILPPHLLLMFTVPFLGASIAPQAWFGYTFLLGDVMDTTRFAVPMLGVLWSLAIEEHFYLAWPAIIRFVRPSKVLAIVLLTIALSPVLRFLATPLVPNFGYIYFLTPFRMDSLAAGCALALLASNERVSAVLRRISMPAFSLVLSVYFGWGLAKPHAFLRETNSRLYNSAGYTLITLGCFFFMAHLLADERSLAARFMAWRPLAFLGEISYGMYLYHWPLMEIVRNCAVSWLHLPYDHLAALAIDLPVTILIAWASFRWLEAPISAWARQKARSPGYSKPVPAMAASSSAPEEALS